MSDTPLKDPALAFEFKSVTRRFESPTKVTTALGNVSLGIEEGSFVCVIGPSGCGKSTMLNLAAGLMHPDEGVVAYRGEPIRSVNTDVGYMTQHQTLLPWRTVERNVALALEVQRVSRDERRARVADVIRLVGLRGSEHLYPAQLSGGMQRRVSLARTLVYDPTTLLMDEPFGALDAQLRLTLQRELLTIWQSRRPTVIFVTHDLDEAILLADRIVVFGANPGRIIHVEDLDRLDVSGRVVDRRDAKFVSTWERLWELLKPEVRDDH